MKVRGSHQPDASTSFSATIGLRTPQGACDRVYTPHRVLRPIGSDRERPSGGVSDSASFSAITLWEAVCVGPFGVPAFLIFGPKEKGHPPTRAARAALPLPRVSGSSGRRMPSGERVGGPGGSYADGSGERAANGTPGH